MNKTMKTWHFDIKLGNGQVASIDAYTFEEAMAILKLDNRFIEGNWTLVGVEDKIPESDQTDEEIEKQSKELWAKVEWKKLDEARKTLEAGYEAFKNAIEFDCKHQDILLKQRSAFNRCAFDMGKRELTDAEKCIDYANRWLVD